MLPRRASTYSAQLTSLGILECPSEVLSSSLDKYNLKFPSPGSKIHLIFLSCRGREPPFLPVLHRIVQCDPEGLCVLQGGSRREWGTISHHPFWLGNSKELVFRQRVSGAGSQLWSQKPLGDFGCFPAATCLPSIVCHLSLLKNSPAAWLLVLVLRRVLLLFYFILFSRNIHIQG